MNQPDRFNIKFNNRLSEFYTRLKKYVSDDLTYSNSFILNVWNQNDIMIENINNTKRSIINSVIGNKYKKSYIRYGSTR